jgi:RimJ/RimL family protein N-acetyltransferase
VPSTRPESRSAATGGPSDDTEVTVRRCTAEDADAFVALFESVAAEGRWIARELPLSDGVLSWIRSRADDPRDDEATFVAVVERHVVGWAAVRLDGRGHAELAMGVAAGWRGQGIGSRLLDTSITWARNSDAFKVCLEVFPHNVAARQLYERFGFEVEGRLRRHWRRANGELWDSVVMGLVLDETSPGSSLD